MNNKAKTKWNQRYHGATVSAPVAANMLADNIHLLPTAGKALDLACGRGGNAMCLAGQGLETEAWDISDVAIFQLNGWASEKHLSIKTSVRDVIEEPPKPGSFDVIIVSHFLERSLLPDLKKAIAPGGLLFYQTYIKDNIYKTGPKNPAYLLDENELLSFFINWIIRVYREEGSIGDPSKGFRDQAGLVAQKPG